MEKLQFITHQTDRYTTLSGARLALDGGCRWIQLRMKETPDDNFVEMAKTLRQLTNRYGAKLILDDRVWLINETAADGVHLGKTDMPVTEARQLLGNDVIIGATANSFEDIEDAVASGADYIGLGPFRFTTTKKNLSPVLGIDGYRKIIRQVEISGFQISIVAIGGIEPSDIAGIMQTGVSGIALSGTILRADDPAEMTKKIINILNQK